MQKLRKKALDELGDQRLMAFMASQDVREIKTLIDAPFEPVIIAIDRYMPNLWCVFLVAIPMGMAVAFVVSYYLGSALVSFSMLLGFPMALLFFGLMARLDSRYYRITPGTMDLIRFKTWIGNSKGVVISSWDLRKMKVACFEDLILISNSNEAAGGTLINAGRLSEPQLFVYSLFRAAISTATVPALPPDKLP